MKSAGVIVTIISLFYYSCKPSGERKETAGTESDTTKFFQVSQYFQDQVNQVKKKPYYIYKINITDGKRDSTSINTETFIKISESFLHTDINSPNTKRNYTESIFHDQTTNSYTINYTTSNKDLEIQNVDVLLDEDGQTVKRVFLRKFLNYPDSSAIEQLSWKSGEMFQINRMVQIPGNKEVSYQTIVVWNGKI